MFQYSYAYDKLHITVQTLATGKDDVRSRLVDAFMNFHTLEEDDFPPELQKDWRWVMDQLTKFGPIYGQKGEIRFGSVELYDEAGKEENRSQDRGKAGGSI